MMGKSKDYLWSLVWLYKDGIYALLHLQQWFIIIELSIAVYVKRLFYPVSTWYVTFIDAHSYSVSYRQIKWSFRWWVKRNIIWLCFWWLECLGLCSTHVWRSLRTRESLLATHKWWTVIAIFFLQNGIRLNMNITFILRFHDT